MVFLLKQDGLHFLEKVVVVPCLRWFYFMVRTNVFSGKWGPLNLVFNIFRQLWRNFVCGRWQVPSIKHMLWEWKKYVSISLLVALSACSISNIVAWSKVVNAYIQVWEVERKKHQPGIVLHTIGWPLDTKTYGGSFLYHMDNCKASYYVQWIICMVINGLYLLNCRTVQHISLLVWHMNVMWKTTWGWIYH